MGMLVFFIIATIAAMAVCIILMFWEGKSSTSCTFDMIVTCFSYIGVVVNAILLIILIIDGCFYMGAKYKTSILNREYGTNYTTNEVFWASDVIDTIREIDRTRSSSTIDLNINEER